MVKDRWVKVTVDREVVRMEKKPVSVMHGYQKDFFKLVLSMKWGKKKLMVYTLRSELILHQCL